MAAAAAPAPAGIDPAPEIFFEVAAADQLFYNASLANLAHSYGLTVALKNESSSFPI